MFLWQEFMKENFNLYNQINENELHLGELSEIRKSIFKMIISNMQTIVAYNVMI